MRKIFQIILVIVMALPFVGCSIFASPTTVVDSSNGTTVNRDESPAEKASTGYFIPILIAVVLGGYFMKCAKTGNCKD